MKRGYTVAVTLAAWLAAGSAGAQTEPSRGRLLYETHCIACHNSQIHWREKRLATDWDTLVALVWHWQARASLEWPEADVQAVAQHLNETIYRLPRPDKRAALRPPATPGG